MIMEKLANWESITDLQGKGRPSLASKPLILEIPADQGSRKDPKTPRAAFDSVFYRGCFATRASQADSRSYGPRCKSIFPVASASMLLISFSKILGVSGS